MSNHLFNWLGNDKNLTENRFYYQPYPASSPSDWQIIWCGEQYATPNFEFLL